MFGTYVVGKHEHFIFSVFCVGVSVIEVIEQREGMTAFLNVG